MTSPEIIRPVVTMDVRFPLSLRNVEDLLNERGIDFNHESVRFWWNRFGSIFAAVIRQKRTNRMLAFTPLSITTSIRSDTSPAGPISSTIALLL
jgi:putative transposase